MNWFTQPAHAHAHREGEREVLTGDKTTYVGSVLPGLYYHITWLLDRMHKS